MKRIFLFLALIISIGLPITASAEPWGIIIGFLEKMAEAETGVKVDGDNQVSALNEITSGLTGLHNYGRGFNESKYDWGSANWQDILAMAKGGGTGDLANAINRLANDFPTNGLNSQNQTENKYYDIAYKTALASRAASEVAYKQADNEQKTINSLNKQIDIAQDEKSASDLNNRFASEQASNTLQQTKLLSVLVQQAALQQQEKVNVARENMDFLK